VNDFAVPGEPVAYPGELVTVEITEAGDYDLVGRVVARDARPQRRARPAAPTARAAGRAALRVLP